MKIANLELSDWIVFPDYMYRSKTNSLDMLVFICQDWRTKNEYHINFNYELSYLNSLFIKDTLISGDPMKLMEMVDEFLNKISNLVYFI